MRIARDELTKLAKPHESGRIVAELNFGFWHSMFNRPYEGVLWYPNAAALLVAVFPHLPRTLRTRQAVWDRCDRIRKLRNRVMHDEPIWHRQTLASEHAQIVEALGWINMEMRDTIALCDRFPAVNQNSRQGMEQKIKNHLGIA